MQFEPNAGQTGSEVKFLARGKGYSLFLKPGEVALSLRSVSTNARTARPTSGQSTRLSRSRSREHTVARAELRTVLLGADPRARIEGMDESPGTVNYFIGNDPRQWRTGIHPFAKVKYSNVYPGVDLVYYGNQRQLEYDFVVSPGADPSRITLGFDGVNHLDIDEQGNLVAQVPGGTVLWRKPVAYQEVAGTRKAIEGKFMLKTPRQVGFQVELYDSSVPLIIDPAMVYSTYLGGSGDDTAEGIAVDGAGNVYVAGSTSSVDFPTYRGYDTTPNGSNDVFMAKLNASGTALIYSTYVGGAGDDWVGDDIADLVQNITGIHGGLAVDTNGNAYVAGWTYSPNFPMRNAAQNTSGGGADAFLFKLGPAGTNLLYSTYLGGPGDDIGHAVAVDNSGNAYVAGETYSGRNFPTQNPFQSKAGGYPQTDGQYADAFVAKYNTTLSGSGSIVYASWLGGSQDDRATAIAVDAVGNVYVTGIVDDSFYYFAYQYPNAPSSDFPTVNAFQPNFNAGSTDVLAGVSDGFLAKINPAGSAVLFATFLGGSGDDAGLGITLDASTNIYVVGMTSSGDFPLQNATQPVNVGADYLSADAFITVFSNSGTSLRYSTYLGGTSDDAAYDASVDRFGNIYVTGYTTSFDFPVTVGADQTNSAGIIGDAFVAKINPAIADPAGIVYATFLGGSEDQHGTAIALDANANFYISGYTASIDFPTTSGVLQGTNGGGYLDAFVAKFASPPDISVAMFLSSDPVTLGSNLTYTIRVNNNGLTSFTGTTNLVQIPTNLQILSVTTTLGSYSTNAGLVTFNMGTLTNNASVLQTIVARALTPGATTNTATVSSYETQAGLEPNTGNNTETLVSAVRGITDVTLTQTATPNPVVLGGLLTYTITVANKGPWPATSLVVTDALPAGVAYWSNSPSQGFAHTNFGPVTWTNFGTLAPGSNATLIIYTFATAVGSVVNAANAQMFEVDPNPANNTATTVTTVNPMADLAVSQTATTNSVFAGANLTYTILITNRGPSDATGAVLTDPLPPGVAFITATVSQGTYSQAGGTVTCSLGTLTNGTSATITVTAQPQVAGSITNTVAASSPVADTGPGPNSASVVTTVIPAADLSVAQTAQPNPSMVFNNVTLSVLVTNRGPSPATGVIMADALPAGLVFVSASSPGSWTQSGGVVTCNLGTLAGGAAATVSIVVKSVNDLTFTNSANVSSGVADLNLNNNTTTAAVTATNNPAAPLLRITLGNTNVVLSWSTNAAGFVLQSRLDVTTNSTWTTMPNTPAIVGNRYQTSDSRGSSTKYYRLFKPSGGVRLAASLVGTSIVLSWPTNAVGYILEINTNLSNPAAWSVVSTIPAVIDGQYYVTNPINLPAAFYRLF